MFRTFWESEKTIVLLWTIKFVKIDEKAGEYMASIKKRGETYLISVSAGYGMDGKQKRQPKHCKIYFRAEKELDKHKKDHAKRKTVLHGRFFSDAIFKPINNK